MKTRSTHRMLFGWRSRKGWSGTARPSVFLACLAAILLTATAGPQLTHGTDCSDPVLEYAPDGSRVYYAYLDISVPTTFTVLVSYSDDDAKSWSGPIVALSRPAADYDKPWIGTHVPLTGSQTNANWIYVSATKFEFAASPDCAIDFTRSSDKGMTWSPAQTLDGGNCTPPGGIVVVQGSRPQDGLGNGVIAAWYHSGVDGFRAGQFQIRTRYSADNGATFAPTVIAATDQFELQQFLGPALAYHRWWADMFPDIEIAPNGSAHIAYTHDPQAGSGVPSNTEDKPVEIRRVNLSSV